MPNQILLRKGLYTDGKGKAVAYVVSHVYENGWDQVDFDNVRTGEEYSWPVEKFTNHYPNRVDKIEISFSE